MSFFSDKEFEAVLAGGWDQLCFTAYDGFRRFGKGLVAVSKAGDEVKAVFTHPAEGHCEVQDLDLINRYNPETEVVVKYPSAQGKTKTIKLEVADENSPAKIWEKFNLGEDING